MEVFQGLPYIILNLTQNCHSYMCLCVFHISLSAHMYVHTYNNTFFLFTMEVIYAAHLLYKIMGYKLGEKS